MAFGIEPPNYPANGLSLNDPFPRGMTVAELARHRGSMYVLAAKPRTGNRFAPDTAGFRPGLHVAIFSGVLRWNGSRHVAPATPFTYEWVDMGRVRYFETHRLTVEGADGGWRDFDLNTHFALAEDTCVRALGGCWANMLTGKAPTYPTKGDDRT